MFCHKCGSKHVEARRSVNSYDIGEIKEQADKVRKAIDTLRAMFGDLPASNAQFLGYDDIKGEIAKVDTYVTKLSHGPLARNAEALRDAYEVADGLDTDFDIQVEVISLGSHIILRGKLDKKKVFKVDDVPHPELKRFLDRHNADLRVTGDMVQFEM